MRNNCLRHIIRLWFVIIAMVSFSEWGHAHENKNIDSLYRLVKTSKTDSALCCVYDALANEYKNINPVKGLPLAHKGLYYAKRSAIKRYEVDMYHTLGLLHRLMSNYDSSLYYHHKGLDITLKQKLKTSYLERAYSFLNLSYTEQGNFTAGLEYGFKFLKLIQHGKDSLRTALAYNNIANTYFGIDNHNKAIFYYKKALVLAKAIKHTYGICLLTSNIGSVYYEKKELDSAIVYFRKSLGMAKKLNDPSSIAIALSNIASYHDRSRNYDSALVYFTKANELYIQLNMRAELSGAYYNMATVYLSQKQYQKSLEFAKKSIDIALDIKSLPHQKGAFLALTNVYDKMGDIPNAYKNFKEFIRVRDSLDNEENKRNQYKEEIDYEYDMKKYADSLDQKKRIELSRQRLKAEKEKSAWRQRLVYVALVALLVMLCLSLFIYKGYRDKKKANDLISEQKKQVEVQKLEIEQKNHEILDSITYAKRIQEAILPSRKRIKEYFPESFVLYRPKDIVAGDFYWLEEMNNTIYIASADCTGHGVPGAMVSVVCHNALNRSLREFGKRLPGEILDKTRELVIEHFSKSEQEVKDGMDIALCAIEFRISDTELNNNSKLEISNPQIALQFSGANNPIWIVTPREHLDCKTIKVKHKSDNLWLHEIKGDKQPVGNYADARAFYTHTLSLQKGDQVYIFTDGYADQFGGEKGKKLKASNFKDVILIFCKEKMENQGMEIAAVHDKWKGNLEQIDDVCVMGFKI